jgi:hypothetical protein
VRRRRSFLFIWLLLASACKATGASQVKDSDVGADPAADATTADPDANPSTNSAIPADVKLWPDHFPNALPGELAAAAAAHISPVVIEGPDSTADIGAGGCPFKWVLAPDGTFYGMKYLPGDIIKHTIATKGQPVISGGFAVSQNGAITIDDHSGHYQPDLASLNIAVAVLQTLGFTPAQIAPDGVTVPDGCAFKKKK